MTILNLGYGLCAALATHACDQGVKQTGVVIESIDKESPIVKTFADVLAKGADYLQQPMTTVSEQQNKLVRALGEGDDADQSVERQQKASMGFELINRTIIAPIIEETLYRGPQLLAGAALQYFTGINPLLAQGIVGAASNCMFGFAHTGAPKAIDRLLSSEFLSSFAKGIPLSITAGIGGIVPAIIGHSLSNMPQAIAQFKKSYAQL